MVKLHLDTNLVNKVFDVKDWGNLIYQYQKVYGESMPLRINKQDAEERLHSLRVIVCGDKLYSSRSITEETENSGLLKHILGDN